MKKLLSALGVIAIAASTTSVASCSLVNNTKQYVKNKVLNLVNISSTLLRGAIIQNATQDLNRGLALDNDYLSSMILGNNALNLMKDFKTSPQTTMESLKNSYFPGQQLDRATINTWNEKQFLTDSVKSPNGPLDSIGGLLTLGISTIKSSGGINSSLVGTIEGALPLIASNDLANSLNPDSLEPIAKVLEDNAYMFSQTIANLSDSNVVYSLIANLLNVNFINAIKEFNFSTIIEGIVNFFKAIDSNSLYSLVDNLGNSILTMDKKENLTYGDITNSVIVRLNNVFARLANKTDQIESDLYKTPDLEFSKKIGTTSGEFLKNLNNISVSSILPSIFDILYIVFGLLQMISSVDFNSFVPTSSQNLFNETQNNSEFLKKLRTTDYEKLDSKQTIKNIFTATSISNNEKGFQLEKLISLLFYSGGEITEIIEPNNGWDLGSILSILFAGDKTSWEGLSPLIFGLGFGIAKWQNIEFLNIGPKQLGMILKSALLDGISENKNLSGLPSLLKEITKLVSIDIPISLSDAVANDLKNAFSGIWDKDTHVLGELLGSLLPNLGNLSNLSLYSLFSSKIYDEMNISELINWLLINTNSYVVKNKNNRVTESEIETLASGLKQTANSLYNRKFKLLVNGEPWNGNDKNYSSLEALIYASLNQGLKVQQDPLNDEIDFELKGIKAGMQAIGVKYKTNGSSETKFREDSLLNGLNIIFDQKIVKNLTDEILNGFKETTEIKNEVANNLFKPFIKEENFKNNIENYYGIESSTSEAGITYTTTFIDPISKTKFNYQIKLKLEENELNWKIISIDRK
ncbi:hypothetical protein [Spiroplasma taiwanense]|uniref:MOLPALP family lipoprotein n=1 Tax=Spiroplasma taiwanense CT-1 TaxID=1276220 RepID=S5LZ86_9MOLU|nr:hypothetical protein [Spiroplasma taiwanense]AGR41017.1 hypothetical protein STAIW_v1c03590 [Spiroplasma taiwanense CT-1]